MGVSVLVFAVVHTNCIFSDSERGLGLANHLNSQTPDLKPPSQVQWKTPVISSDSSIKQRLNLLIVFSRPSELNHYGLSHAAKGIFQCNTKPSLIRTPV